MSKTKIEWADYTFNPVWGCVEISPACDHCYARTFDKRIGGNHWGPHAPFRTFGENYWNAPIKWNREAELALETRRVFCASMADVFDNRWPDDIRPRLWDLIRATPSLTWMLLTKRPQNISAMLPADWGQGWPNVWLGCTAENQEEADRRIPKLLAVPARIRFVSYEPALSAVNFAPYLSRSNMPGLRMMPGFQDPLPGVHWIIAGGESGPKARPPHPDWLRSARDQCTAAGVPFLFKQWGEWVSLSEVEGPGRHHHFDDGAGVRRVGKSKSGRLLDGRDHSEFPA